MEYVKDLTKYEAELLRLRRYLNTSVVVRLQCTLDEKASISLVFGNAAMDKIWEEKIQRQKDEKRRKKKEPQLIRQRREPRIFTLHSKDPV